jgi:hypothetical protein
MLHLTAVHPYILSREATIGCAVNNRELGANCEDGVSEVKAETLSAAVF